MFKDHYKHRDKPEPVGDQKVLGEYEAGPEKPGGYIHHGWKFQYIGKHHWAAIAKPLEHRDCTHIRWVSTTHQRNGFQSGWSNELVPKYAASDPNIETGPRGPGRKPGCRLTISPGRYSWVDAPSVTYVPGDRESSGYHRIQFALCFFSAPGCPCKRKFICVYYTFEAGAKGGKIDVGPTFTPGADYGSARYLDERKGELRSKQELLKQLREHRKGPGSR